MAQPAFENSGEVPYYADPYDVYLRDATGLLHRPTTVYLPAGMTTAMLEAQTLNPGDHISGYVGFQVPAEATITEIVYYPESSRVVTVAGLDGAAPAGDEGSAEASPAPDV
jgi:hypothetical protein